MQLKLDIKNYIFVCKLMNMFIEWPSEISIFMVNVEQYLWHCRWKRLPKTCSHFLFFMYMSFEDEEKKPNTANAALNIM